WSTHKMEVGVHVMVGRVVFKPLVVYCRSVHPVGELQQELHAVFATVHFVIADPHKERRCSPRRNLVLDEVVPGSSLVVGPEKRRLVSRVLATAQDVLI